MDLALNALRKVNFDWTAHIDEIWVDQGHEAPGIQREARNALLEHLEDLSQSQKPLSPLGVPILGTAGSGKTHLLGFLRRETLARGSYFVLVDMTDVSDFWETVSLGYLRSLQHQLASGRRQVDHWLDRMIALYGQSLRKPEDIPRQRPPGLINRTDELIQQVRNRHRAEVQEHADVLRALVLFACDDADINDLGYKWLQGMVIDDDELGIFGFRQKNQSPSRIVRGISWLLSLTGPTVLALDQMDAIVAEHELSRSDAGDEHASEQRKRSLAIIQGIASGLLDLRDVTRRTLSVVSSLETTWVILDRQAPVSMGDRFGEKLLLKPSAGPDALQELVERRLRPAYEAASFVPEYPSFPYAPSFFEKYRSNTPREVLKACEVHRRACRAAGIVTSTDEVGSVALSLPTGWAEDLDARFQKFLQEVRPDEVIQDEDEKLQDLLIETACDAIVLENPAPPSVAVKIDKDFMRTGNYAPLHARIRLILTEDHEREVHFAFRFLEKGHHRAFQARLKAALTASGIDKDLRFRGLTILRQGPIPPGPATAKLVEDLRSQGGTLLSPSSTELATVLAVQKLLETADDSDPIDKWLELRRPVSKLSCFKPAIAALSRGLTEPSPESVAALAKSSASPPPPEPSVTAASAPGTSVPSNTPEASPAQATGVARVSNAPPLEQTILPIGKRYSPSGPGDVVGIPADQLLYHTCVFAGSGSGKTVFLKRVIEEAALMGIPSIVLDGANDLSRLGSPWPHEEAEKLSEADQAKANRYHEQAEIAIWTPGAPHGNPMRLNPLPDFTLVSATPEEREAELATAIEIATTSLTDLLVKSGNNAAKQINILKSTLQHFARKPGTIRDFVELLREPPDDVIEPYERGARLATELAELLHSQLGIDPLIGGSGAPLDPAVLFRSNAPGKTRVSVLNLVGLPSYDQKRRFVDQLAASLFSWIKKNPAPPGGILGLLVIDEAKDFVPSGKTVPGKENLLRLAAQARKYGLGLLFATQEPKSIDNKVVSNCSILLGGKVSSPAAISALQELLAHKGTPATDVAALPRGTFYFGLRDDKPRKITTSLCLSWHPSAPPSETEILEEAKKSRARFGPPVTGTQRAGNG